MNELIPNEWINAKLIYECQIIFWMPNELMPNELKNYKLIN